MNADIKNKNPDVVNVIVVYFLEVLISFLGVPFIAPKVRLNRKNETISHTPVDASFSESEL